MEEQADQLEHRIMEGLKATASIQLSLQKEYTSLDYTSKRSKLSTTYQKRVTTFDQEHRSAP
jgi:hypothetical protein